MLSRIQVLVIGRHAEIMESVLQRINDTDDWEAAGAMTDKMAIEIFQQRRFDLVLIGGGVEAESEAKLSAVFSFQNPLIKMVRHFGNTELFAEIRAALEAQQEGNK